MPRPNHWFKIRAQSSDAGSIVIDGDIGSGLFFDEGTQTSPAFRRALSRLGRVKTINLSMNTLGGNIWEGISIANQLADHPARIVATVTGVVASIGANILMHADEIRMPSNTQLMIHNPWGAEVGEAGDLRKVADRLDLAKESITTDFVRRSGLPADQIKDMMTAETWMTAARAKKLGFADTVLRPVKMAAGSRSTLSNRFRNPPQTLVAWLSSHTIGNQSMSKISFTPGLKSHLLVALEAAGGAEALQDLIDSWEGALSAEELEAAFNPEDNTITHLAVEDLTAITDGLDITLDEALKAAFTVTKAKPKRATRKKAAPAVDFQARAKSISDLCALADKPELAGPFIADPSVTVEHVREELLNAKADDDTDDEPGEIQGTHDALPKKKQPEESPLVARARQHREEWERRLADNRS